MAVTIPTEDYTIICGNCGARVFDEHAAACPACGAPLVLSESELKAREERERKANNSKIIGIVLAVSFIVFGLSLNFLGFAFVR